MQRLVLAAALCSALLVTASSEARAGTIYGTWSSTSGNVFEIPYSGGHGFDMILTYPSGQRVVLRAHWVAGMRGTQFTYRFGRFTYTATFSQSMGNRLRVVSSPGGQVSWWKRHRRASRSMLWAGTWRSTSGNLFVVPASRGSFNIIIKHPNGTQRVVRAHWVAGMEGTQFYYYFGRDRVTATFNARDRNRIRTVNSAGTVTFWTRIN